MSDSEILINEPLDEATELSALAKALTFGAGNGFKLLFARISHDRHRQRLEQSLVSKIKPLKLLRVVLAEDVSFVLDELQIRFEAGRPDALSVSGLDWAIFASETPGRASVLAGLNIGRSSFFTRLPCPLLLWVTPDALAHLARGAPDFFSIRSGVYLFEERVPVLSWILEELQELRQQSNPPLARLSVLLEEIRQQPWQQRSIVGQAFLLLGDCFLRANRPDLAERVYLSGQIPFLQLRQNRELSQAWLGLGLARHRLGKTAEAKDTLESALDLARSERLLEEETLALLCLGDVYLELGDPFKAGDAFQRASILADDIGNGDWVHRAIKGLALSGSRAGSEKWAMTRRAPKVNLNSIDFLILAPLKEEREAVLAHLGTAARLPPDEQDVRVYYQADVATQLAGGTAGSYRVIVTSPLGMGRVEAATATADAIRRFAPRYVLLVGIAGGDPDEVGLGDVLLAEQFIDYEPAKLTNDGTKVRYQTFRADPRLYGAAQRVSGWEAAVLAKRPDEGAPSVHTGVVISGDKVQAATNALSPYKADWPKPIGVEMEAAGVAAAAWEAASKPGVLMVRGVSDLADAKKGSARVKMWRSYACDVAAAFAVSLLRDGPVPLRASGHATATAPQSPQNQSPTQRARAQPATTPSTQVQETGNVVGIGAIGGSGHQIHATVNPGAGAAGQAAESAPVRTTPGPWPTVASLRKVLQQVLRIDSDLDAFCLDYFPQVKRLFSAGMDTERKRSLLLEKEDPARIWKFLQTAEPAACRKYAYLIELEG